MRAIDYIEKKLLEIVFKFPSIKLSYDFDELSNTHIIQVDPFDIFEYNEEYKSFEADISYEFDNKYYPSSLLFVSEESLTTVDNPLFERCGILYGTPQILSQKKTQSFNMGDQLVYYGDRNQDYSLAA